MGRYLLKRIVQIIPVLLILTLIIFCLVYVAGDPVALMLPPEAGEQAKAALREALGLDRPFYEQFFIYIGNLLRGDFGTSYQYNQDALSLVMERIPYSLQLAGVSLAFSVLVGVVLGVAAAHFRNTPFDLLVNGFAALGQAMPGFWVAIMLILVFSVNLKLLPVSGSGTWQNLVLPAATLTLVTAAKIIPLVRSNMKEKEFVRASKTLGAPSWHIIFHHVLPNVWPSFIVVSTMSVAGSIITEASLSFLGVGIQAPLISWGGMLSDGRVLLATHWWVATFPGIMITVAILGITFLGNWLRDVLDPHNKGL